MRRLKYKFIQVGLRGESRALVTEQRWGKVGNVRLLLGNRTDATEDPGMRRGGGKPEGRQRRDRPRRAQDAKTQRRGPEGLQRRP